ncbi:MAG: S8 family serine peptidase [FCB group bacterium]|nr:S8 family serine peptidase [FCB group bacterium]
MNKKVILIPLLLLAVSFSNARDIVRLNGFDASAKTLVIKINAEIAPVPGRSEPLQLTSNNPVCKAMVNFGASKLQPLFMSWRQFGDAHIEHELHQYYTVEFDHNMDIAALILEAEAIEGIEKAEPDYIATANLVPNDTYYPEQWAHNNYGQAGSGNVGVPDCDTDTEEAWDITTGSSDITIAILDTGVNGNHSEFAGKMVDGWDFINNDDNASDDFGHGTSCAGIAAAIGNNNSGIAGVSWQSLIMPVKILDSNGSGNDTQIANGVIFATDNGARIISMSLGGGSYVSYFDNAITYAVENGTVVFAAAGNDNSSQVSYPSLYDDCISVGALSPCNERKNPLSCDGESWWGSNYGDGLDFMAPGVLIYTTTMSGGYISNFNGTSSACPHAAGIGALVLSVTPGMSPEQVRSVMQLTSDDLYGAGWDAETGYGRLNAFQAVSYSISTPEINLDVESVSFDLAPGASDSTIVLVYNTGEDDLTYTIDTEGYYWTDSDGPYIDYDWIDIEGLGTQMTFTHNDQAADETIDLGFEFPFYGETYSQCIVNANGWIGFGEDNVEWSNTIIPDPAAPRPAVFGYWDDLNPNNTGNSDQMAGDVYYLAEDGRLIVWFDHVVHWYGSNSIEGTYDFEMVLYADGTIRYNYRTMEGEVGLATIGIQNAAGDDAVMVNYNQAYAHDGLSVLLQTPHPWLSVAPAAATIAPGEAVELNIGVDSAGVPQGEFQDWLVFTTNDYANVHPVISVLTTIGSGGCSDWEMGDVNQDGILNILDIITIVNIVLETIENPPDCIFWAADLNADGENNILDVILLLNIILGT